MTTFLSAALNESRIEVADGFTVDLIYSVPTETQGSWVALTVDDQGRLLTGDQDGQIYRLTLNDGSVDSVETLELEIGYVHGLTYAFDSLYAVVAEERFEGPGLYRLWDRDGDDSYDEVKFLRSLPARGEHGPHNVVVGPDGKSLYVVAGNHTPIPYGDGFRSLVPPHWGEDDLLTRLWGPIGSEKGTPAPGGWIARTDPNGESWELIAIGFRNAFDIAFNRHGDLFATDADAEFDMGTPWYQPTRLMHVVSGVDYGWRSGSGKWPRYFADTLPPVYEYGPGSPTGITFGYGTHFPSKYQEALFACDWSWGRIFVSWLKPDGASYTSETEEFLTGMPLAIADLIANPFDGAMYFVLGGRGSSSALYRIRYVGDSEATNHLDRIELRSPLSSERKELESLLTSTSKDKISIAWLYLSHEDRFLRHGARMVLEHQPPEIWMEKAIREKDPTARMTALLALARAGSETHLLQLIGAVVDLDWNAFSKEEMYLGLRCLEVAFIRMGSPKMLRDPSEEMPRLLGVLEAKFPTSDTLLNAELLKLLVYLNSEHVTAPAMALMEAAVTQIDKLRYLVPLRLQVSDWTPELRERYFTMLGQAHGWLGGRSFSKYIEKIVEESIEPLSERQRERYLSVMEQAKPDTVSTEVGVRPFVKLWTLKELLPIQEQELEGRDLSNGRQAFADATCFACHRVKSEGGGIGPDLSAVSRRFSTRDLLEAIIEPSKVISDQYGLTLLTRTDGSQVIGKVVNYFKDSIGVQSDPLNSAKITRVPRNEIETVDAPQVSSMPAGLLSTLTREDILDMVAYLQQVANEL